MGIRQVRGLVRNGLFYLTEHAYDEADDDDLDIYDVEYSILTGIIRRTWPSEGKFEIVGTSMDGRPVGIVGRLTKGGKVCIITVYVDRQ